MMLDKAKTFLRDVHANTTIEPLLGLFYLITALLGIPGEELYLKKACSVNFNNSDAICDNIYQHKEVQIETQKYISGVQVRMNHLRNAYK